MAHRAKALLGLVGASFGIIISISDLAEILRFLWVVLFTKASKLYKGLIHLSLQLLVQL